MQKSAPVSSFSIILTTGLAIFSMLFGAGNLMYPLHVGMNSGTLYLWGMIGFLLTAALLPIAGFVAMILFDGDYDTFFGRLGSLPCKSIMFFCMFIMGPGIAIPRITTLSHTMIAPFIPFASLRDVTFFSSFLFGLLFLGVTFLCTYKERKIVNLLGHVISPILLMSLVIIIAKGMFAPGTPGISSSSITHLFTESFLLGYGTLDLLGGLFFSSIVITILKRTAPKAFLQNRYKLASIGLRASLLGVTLLSIVYVGMGFLGAYHSTGILFNNPGDLFREISFAILGSSGALIIVIAVLMACLSTSIALSAILAEYIHKNIFNTQLSYTSSLIFLLATCLPLSVMGLSYIVHVTKVIATLIYPMIVTITFCNIAYKLWGFRPIKVPALATFLLTLIFYFYR